MAEYRCTAGGRRASRFRPWGFGDRAALCPAVAQWEPREEESGLMGSVLSVVLSSQEARARRKEHRFPAREQD